MRILILLIWLSGFVNVIRAQSDESIHKIITDMLESIAEKQTIEMNFEELIDDLVELSLHPMNLNEVTKIDLETLFFLTDYQIENILYYIYSNGPLQTIFELQAVEGLDYQTIRHLVHFVFVGESPSKGEVLHLSGTVLSRYQTVFQNAKGYVEENDSTPSAYIGGKDRVLLKGRLQINNRVETGFTLEKDPGEEYFSNSIPFTDFASGFIQFNKPVKWVNKIIIGDYKASFGQGVGMWTDMAFSKSSETSQLRRRPKGVYRYTSTNEASFLRGVGAELSYKDFSLSPFVSYKQRDASLEMDSITNAKFILSLKEDGYHRTSGELDNQKSVDEWVAGGRLAYRHHLFHIESGYVSWNLNYPIKNSDHLRNLYRFADDEQTTGWFSYSLFLNRLTLFGEAALQQNKYSAFYQGLTYQAGSDVVMSLAYRSYDASYSAILANPFSESSILNGESGFYGSIRFRPHQKMLITAYGDIFEYNWLRYNVYAPSSGFECFIQADFALNNYCDFYLRYKSTQKSINSNHIGQSTYAISSYQKDNIRFCYNFCTFDKFKLQTQVEHSIYRRDEESATKGWLFYQDFKLTPVRNLTIGFRYVYFDIEDYNSRIYMYEPDVLYAFTIPAYMDKGSRLIVNVKWVLTRDLKVWFRLAHSYYKGKQSLSSGWNEISGNEKTEGKIQVQFRF
ncbi:MAG: helix-hairpin-helix domain-containing protein [Marinilabiliaceae bacterium]|nr:helix-hairpin-helix domain-containing protein [Marinilabiliaceae bacterium]